MAISGNQISVNHKSSEVEKCSKPTGVQARVLHLKDFHEEIEIWNRIQF